MLRIDPSQAEKVNEYCNIALHIAVQTGVVSLKIKQRTTKVSSIDVLRKLFKSELYRCAAIRRWDSDEDFKNADEYIVMNFGDALLDPLDAASGSSDG